MKGTSQPEIDRKTRRRLLKLLKIKKTGNKHRNTQNNN